MTADLAPVIATLLDAFDDERIGVHVFRIADNDLHRLAANRSGAALLGYTVDELFAIPWIDTIAPGERAGLVELTRRVSSGEAPIAAIDLDLLHKDGHVVRTAISTTYREDPGGPILVCLFREPTTASPRVLEADRLAVVGALAAGIAHEINNPLTYLLLHLRSLRRSVEEWAEGHAVEATRRIDEAHSGAERIRAIVRAVMTFAVAPGAPTDVDLGAVVQNALRLARPELESRARIACQIFPVAAVRAEEPRLGQAVLSMLLFAGAGFTGDDPTLNRIAIAVEMRDGHVVVEVADNGTDLSAAELGRVREPSFVRTTGVGPGYGLGMARSIAIAAGGRFAVAPRPGGGVVVTLSLRPVETAGSGVATGPARG